MQRKQRVHECEDDQFDSIDRKWRENLYRANDKIARIVNEIDLCFN